MRININTCTLKASVLLLFMAAFSAHAQEFRAVLTGQVNDPSGAVIPSGAVTAVNVDSGTRYTATTTDKGLYYIPYVLPGNYRVTATANGFETSGQDKVVLLASKTFNQNFSLEVGSVAQQVVVESTPAQL